MPTLSAGVSTEVYVPVSGSMTVTPGAGGRVRVDVSVRQGMAPVDVVSPIHSARTFSVPGGATVFLEAIGAAASYSSVAEAGVLSAGKQINMLASGQPASIARGVTSQGKMIREFSGAVLTVVAGSTNVTVTNDHTGYDGSNNPLPTVSRTGLPRITKVELTSDTTQTIEIANGVWGSVQFTQGVGFWVYYDNTAKVGGGGPQLLIDFYSGATTGGAYQRVAFTGSQLRNGWNFLVYKQIRADLAAMPSSDTHFASLTTTKFSDGVDINVTPIHLVRVSLFNMNGCTLYFDSVWTGFASKSQIILGVDQATADTVSIALPEFQRRGWKGYFAAPFRGWSSGSKIITDFSGRDSFNAQMEVLYAAGWDAALHTLNHLANGTLTVPSEIRYEIEGSKAWQAQLGLIRGSEFYASPQSSTSNLAEKVIAGLGIKLQRHASNAHQNVHVTQFGVDNMASFGGADISSASAGFQQFSKIKVLLDNLWAYGASSAPFWHAITTLGDTGSGEDLTGNDLTMTRSAFLMTTEYIAQGEAQGKCVVPDGFTGFYYGTGRWV